MSLSTMQEILILLEDEKEVPLFRINRWGRSARGALAKLKNLKFIEKIRRQDDIYYKITDEGEKYFDETLEVLKVPNKWDNKWRLVIFNIPETNRAVRDKLRRALTKLGMGILQSSIWISPLDLKIEVDNLAKKLKIEDKVKFFEVTATNHLNQQIIDRAWDLPQTNLSLERFIKESEWALKKMGKGNGDRFNAKKLIFDYALIIANDPRLPQDFIEQNTLRKKAREQYLQLRRHVL